MTSKKTTTKRTTAKKAAAPKTYKVLVMFEDLEDNRHRYEVGDTYPRHGLKPTAARVAELKSTENKRGLKLIE